MRALLLITFAAVLFAGCYPVTTPATTEPEPDCIAKAIADGADQATAEAQCAESLPIVGEYYNSNWTSTGCSLRFPNELNGGSVVGRTIQFMNRDGNTGNYLVYSEVIFLDEQCESFVTATLAPFSFGNSWKIIEERLGDNGFPEYTTELFHSDNPTNILYTHEVVMFSATTGQVTETDSAGSVTIMNAYKVSL